MVNIEHLLKSADEYEQACILKEGKIKKLPNGKYRVVSEQSKNLGTYNSREGAKKRLRQIEYFKHVDKADDGKVLDLTRADDFSYSAIMRCLKKDGTKEQMMEFLKIFKNLFDKAVKEKLNKPERVALQKAVLKLSKKYPIKLSKEMIKNAAISELGNPVQVGMYLADIIKFTLNKLPTEKRSFVLPKLRNKIYYLNEQEIAVKNMPATSTIGQSITFVKHVLFNHDAQYIREVLNNIAKNLV